MEAGGFLSSFACLFVVPYPGSLPQLASVFWLHASQVPQPGENDDEVSSLKPRLLDSERLDFSVTLDSLDSQGQNDLFTAFVHEYAPLGCPG